MRRRLETRDDRSGRRRVLLYQPPVEHATLPLALLALASALDRDRYEPVIVDARMEADPLAALVERIDERTLCLGISVLTGPPIAGALAASRAAKARRPDLPVVWGGWHPSLFAAQCLAEPSVDLVVMGQGEPAWVEIVGALDAGQPAAGLAGCAWRAEDGRVEFGPPRPALPVEACEAVDYSLLDLEAWFARKGRRQLDFVASQGCYWRCAFCADPRVYRRSWSGLSAAGMLEQLRRLHRRYAFEDLAFQDETFFTHPERAIELARGLLEAGPHLTWTATIRADQADRIDDGQMALLAASGLRRVLLGVESGSPRMLRRLQKDVRLEQVMLAAEKLRRHGIRADLPFIVGLPGESERDLEASLAWAGRLRAMSPGFQTPIFFYRPYPGSELAEQLQASGHTPPADLAAWSRFDLDGPGSWVPRARVDRARRVAFYLRQAWDPPPHPFKRPIRRLARWRLARGRFEWPWEWQLARLCKEVLDAPSPLR